MGKLFQIDVRNFLETARRKFNNRVEGAEISLPGFTFCISPTDPEKKAARETVIFMGDRRVLNSKECCDNCIDNSLESLQDIRKFLVQKQLDLGGLEFGPNSPIFLLIEFTLEAIRQFLTFHEQLDAAAAQRPPEKSAPSDFCRPRDIREEYFAALERLRAHLNGCKHQIGIIADANLPKVPDNLKEAWKLDCYITT